MLFNFDRLSEPDSVAVMGILNLSPNSFYSKSYFSRIDDVLKYAEKMIKIGFQFVTVGSDQKFMANGANEAVKYMKKTNKSNETNGY